MTRMESTSPVRGYVPGVFDMFHVGHLNIVRQAREQCDYLIVGVVADDVVEGIKGRAPVVPLDERIEIVAALRDVDEVVVDEHADKFDAWHELHYDVIFKGDDWRGTPKGRKLEADLRRGRFPARVLPLHPAHVEHDPSIGARRHGAPDHVASGVGRSGALDGGRAGGRPGPRRRSRLMTGQRTVHILGTHGVPAAYGGFETAAENVGLHLAAKGWRVVVYCQLPGSGSTTTDEWKGIERVLIHEERDGWLGTASFDRRSIAYVLRHRQPGDVCLTFGYNTGVFNLAQRVLGIPNVINMDGMEWTRRRWGVAKQGILLGNERFAGAVGTVLIGDHPIITRYLQRHFGRRRVTTIAYGAYPMAGAPTNRYAGSGSLPASTPR